MFNKLLFLNCTTKRVKSHICIFGKIASLERVSENIFITQLVIVMYVAYMQVVNKKNISTKLKNPNISATSIFSFKLPLDLRRHPLTTKNNIQ